MKILLADQLMINVPAIGDWFSTGWWQLPIAGLQWVGCVPPGHIIPRRPKANCCVHGIRTLFISRYS